MDTINNIANAATKAIWGENPPNTTDAAGKPSPPPPPPTEEPISGVQGDPSKGEPFDAGNAPENAVAVDASTPTTPASTAAPTTAADAGKDAAGQENKPTNGAAHAHPSSKTPGDSTAHQSDTRTPGEGKTSPSAAAEMNDVDNTKVEPLDPASIKGPGPKPLEQVAREHGGDAGSAAHDDADADAAKPQQTPSAPKEDEGVKKSESRGSGEKFVKASGLAADGGDFDAANPGAGREADRLLEEKGISHQKTPPAKKVDSAGSKSVSPTSQSSSPERKGVRGLGHKIKAKLRRGSNNS
ncbi:hypothetical protein RB594_004427 [Gaeumannomyces avenae]